MTTDKLLLYGNSDLTTIPLNEDKTAYDGTATLWSGLVSVDITFTQETSAFPADNDPEYKSVKGKPTGSGTITLRGIKYSDYQKIMSAIYSAQDGVDFGASDEVKYFGFGITEEVDDGSQNRHILFNCRMDGLPPLSTATVAEGGLTPRDIAIPVVVNPLFKPNDRTQWKFYRVLNSVENAAQFTANKNTIVFPYPAA